MSVGVIATLKDGTVLTGISYRLDLSNLSGAQATTGPSYSMQTANGWVTVPVAAVLKLEFKQGRPT